MEGSISKENDVGEAEECRISTSNKSFVVAGPSTPKNVLLKQSSPADIDMDTTDEKEPDIEAKGKLKFKLFKQ